MATEGPEPGGVIVAASPMDRPDGPPHSHESAGRESGFGRGHDYPAASPVFGSAPAIAGAGGGSGGGSRAGAADESLSDRGPPPGHNLGNHSAVGNGPHHEGFRGGDSSHLPPGFGEGCQRLDDRDQDNGCKVYLGNLPFDSDEGAIKRVFEEFGSVVAAKVVYDRETGRSRGFGFVQFTTREAAALAIREMNGQIVDGRAISVREARKPNYMGGRGGGRGGGGRGGGERWGGHGRPFQRDWSEGPGSMKRGRDHFSDHWESPRRYHRSPPHRSGGRVRSRSRSPSREYDGDTRSESNTHDNAIGRHRATMNSPERSSRFVEDSNMEEHNMDQSHRLKDTSELPKHNYSVEESEEAGPRSPRMGEGAQVTREAAVALETPGKEGQDQDLQMYEGEDPDAVRDEVRVKQQKQSPSERTLSTPSCPAKARLFDGPNPETPGKTFSTECTAAPPTATGAVVAASAAAAAATAAPEERPVKKGSTLLWPEFKQHCDAGAELKARVGAGLDELRGSLQRAKQERDRLTAEITKKEESVLKSATEEKFLKERIKALEATKQKVVLELESRNKILREVLTAMAQAQESQERLKESEKDLKAVLRPLLAEMGCKPVDKEARQEWIQEPQES